MTRLALAALAALVLTACASGTGFDAAVVSTIDTIGVGKQRVLVELRDGDGEPQVVDAVPNATLRNEDGSPLGEYPGELAWAVPDEHPVYVFMIDIPEAETYQLTVDLGDAGETSPAGFVAVADPTQVVATEPAPEIDESPTVGPRIVVFASPKWCPSGSCDPMIHQVEEAIAGHPTVELQRVEVFENPDVETEGDLVLSANTAAWGLPSQPWLYAIDSSGTVAAAFEGLVSDTELDEALGLISS